MPRQRYEVESLGPVIVEIEKREKSLRAIRPSVAKTDRKDLDLRLRALEERAIERGNVRCTLTSTETARRFYQANGYVEDGDLAGKFGTRASYAMSKPLVAVQH